MKNKPERLDANEATLKLNKGESWHQICMLLKTACGEECYGEIYTIQQELNQSLTFVKGLPWVYLHARIWEKNLKGLIAQNVYWTRGQFHRAA